MRNISLLFLVLLIVGDKQEVLSEQYRGDYIVYRRDSPLEENDKRLLFAKGFSCFLEKQGIKSEGVYPITGYIFSSQSKFHGYMKSEFGDDDPPGFGSYISSKKSFYTHEHSGLGTITHELMHGVMNGTGHRFPFWAREGIPALSEKIFGYHHQGKAYYYIGFENPWRIRDLGDQLTSLNLKKIVAGNSVKRQHERRLAALFLYRSGHLKEYFRLLKRKNSKGYSTFYEAAMNQTFSRMARKWKTFLNSIESRRDLINTIPTSTIYSNKADFQKMVDKSPGVNYVISKFYPDVTGCAF